MGEYINREELIKAFIEAERDIMADYGPNYGAEWGFSFDTVKQVIDKIPAADVASVVHGRWLDKGWEGDLYFRIGGHGNCWHVIDCSVCGAPCGTGPTKYCPNCGSKMDKEGTK